MSTSWFWFRIILCKMSSLQETGEGNEISLYYFCNFLWLYNYLKIKNFFKCLGTQRNSYNQSAILTLFVSIRHWEENVPSGSLLTNSVLLLCSLSTFKCKHVSFIFTKASSSRQQNPTLWKTITTIKWRPWRLYGLLLERINVYSFECNFHQNFELDLQNPVYFKFAFDAMGYHKKNLIDNL